MPDRKQARAMDLPDYPCPPRLGDIAARAGSWGWFDPPGHIAQDADGLLWVRSDRRLSPIRTAVVYSLAAWTEDGVGLFVPKASYGHINSISTLAEPEWSPVAVVLKEPPAYALGFAD